jgi:hypothetical protein
VLSAASPDWASLVTVDVITGIGYGEHKLAGRRDQAIFAAGYPVALL